MISDEIYSELTFEGKHTSIASLPGMQERTLFLHGFSKGFAMTGFRIGYACGPEPLIEAMMKVHQYSMLCAPILSQEAAIEALKNGTSSVLKMKEAYQKRRDLIVRRFNEMGLNCHLPKGSFYAFPSIAATQMDSIDFCKDLLESEEVRLFPVQLLVRVVPDLFELVSQRVTSVFLKLVIESSVISNRFPNS